MPKEPTYARFGQLARDGRGNPLQTAAKFVTADTATTPRVSPLAYSNTILTITVPDAAVQVILAPTTALRVSEDPTMVHYDVIAAGAKEALPVALMQSVYIRRDTADGTVCFRFAVV
jgi:hypothetical protein